MIRKKPYNSHLTAMSRRSLPAPTKYLLDNGLLLRDVLDFGCGKCHEINNQFCPMDGYDPHFRPNGKTKEKYDTIICNFVLNTIPYFAEREKVMIEMESLLKDRYVDEVTERFIYSRGYVAVRNDVKQLKGWNLSKKTWQGPIQLCMNMIKETPNWILYSFQRWDGYAEKGRHVSW